jgi:ABC-type uncharacterized transport system permease subunit
MYKKKIHIYVAFCLKVLVSDTIFFNRAIITLYAWFKALGLNFFFTKSYVKKKKNYYTVLRSPFVNKKSREQLGVDVSICETTLKIGFINIIIIEFVQFLLLRINRGLFLKVAIKKRLDATNEKCVYVTT